MLGCSFFLIAMGFAGYGFYSGNVTCLFGAVILVLCSFAAWVMDSDVQLHTTAGLPPDHWRDK